MILFVLEQEAVTELERQDLGQTLGRPSLNYNPKLFVYSKSLSAWSAQFWKGMEETKEIPTALSHLGAEGGDYRLQETACHATDLLFRAG